MKAAVFASNVYFRSILAFGALFLVFVSPAFGIAPDVPSCHPQRRVLSSLSSDSIPDQGVLTSQLNATGFPSQIWDLDVITKVAHLKPEQLVITLISPSGTEVTLSSNNGQAAPNAFADVYWDDQADSPVSLYDFSSSAVVNLTPEEPLDFLQGEIPNGDWRLRIEDQAIGVEGVLEHWELRFTLCSPSIEAAKTENKEFGWILPEGEVTSIPLEILPVEGGHLCGIDVTTQVLHPMSDQLRLEIQSPEGKVVTLSEANGSGFENAFFIAEFKNSEDNPVTDSDFYPNPINIPSPLHNLVDSAQKRFNYSPQESLALHYGNHNGANWSFLVSDLSVDGEVPILSRIDVQAYECRRRTKLVPETYTVAENSPVGTEIGTVTGTKPFSVADIAFGDSGSFSTEDDFSREMIISLSEPSIIQSVMAFPSSSGKIHFNYRSTDSPGVSGKIVSEVFIPNIPTRLGLELSLPAGDYIIDARGSTVDSLGYHEFESSFSEESLTVSSPADRSFFFLDWQSRIFIDSFGDKPYAAFCGPLRITQDGRLIVIQDHTDSAGGLDFEKEPVLFCDLLQSPSDAPLRIEILDVDETPPSITCPPDTDVGFSELSEESTGFPIVSDDSGQAANLSYFDSSVSGACPTASRITRTWTATDSQSNVSTCQQFITVRAEDTDGDTVADCQDACPADSNKSEPGVCGCGFHAVEADGEISCAASSESERDCTTDGQDCFSSSLPQSACVNANGFLGQTNIVSVLNLQAEPLSIELQYLDQGGAIRGSLSTSVAAGVKRDFVINELGLLPDSVGTVCVYTDAESVGAWSGGITLYKEDTRVGAGGFGDVFDFAIFHPFLAPRFSSSVLPLNTFHLGTSSEALVANWISITDATPGDGQGLSGLLTVYDGEGKLRSSLEIQVVDGGRVDLPGHDLLTAGENIDAIGLARFEARDKEGAEVGYYISLSRYFYDCLESLCENFLTAFGLPLRDSSVSALYGGVSTVGGELSVVEVLNSTETSALASLTTRNKDSFSVQSTSRSLGPYASTHVIASEVLGENSLGTMAVRGLRQPLSATSLFYKLNPSNVLEYGYSAPLVGFAGTSQISQFNSFIQQQSDFEVYNAADNEISFDVHVIDYEKTTLCSEKDVKLAAGETTRFTPPLPSDSYGTVVVRSSHDGLIFRTYVRRAESYTLAFPGAPVSEELVAKVLEAETACIESR